MSLWQFLDWSKIIKIIKSYQKESKQIQSDQNWPKFILFDIFSGTPLQTASLPTSAHQGPVMLTAKNLQCMRAILSVAHCHGNLLGSSWHIILTVNIIQFLRKIKAIESNNIFFWLSVFKNLKTIHIYRLHAIFLSLSKKNPAFWFYTHTYIPYFLK